jgi:Na+-driven multidrug efflux pump
VCGFNYGAKLYKRVKKAYWFSVRYTTLGLIVLCALLAIFAPQIITSFRSDDPELIRIGTLSLRLHCISLPLTAIVIMSNMLTQTIGKALYASIIAVSRQGLFLIPCLFIFSRVFNMGLLGIQLSIPVADFLGFLLSIPITATVLKQMKDPDSIDESSVTQTGKP